jgi:hypothetical protein
MNEIKNVDLLYIENLILLYNFPHNIVPPPNQLIVPPRWGSLRFGSHLCRAKDQVLHPYTLHLSFYVRNTEEQIMT